MLKISRHPPSFLLDFDGCLVTTVFLCDLYWLLHAFISLSKSRDIARDVVFGDGLLRFIPNGSELTIEFSEKLNVSDFDFHRTAVMWVITVEVDELGSYIDTLSHAIETTDPAYFSKVERSERLSATAYADDVVFSLQKALRSLDSCSKIITNDKFSDEIHLLQELCENARIFAAKFRDEVRNV